MGGLFPLPTSKTMRFIVAVLLCCVALATAQAPGGWKVVDNKYTIYALGVSFQTPQEGWVVGGHALGSSELLFTTNGGQNFTNAPLEGGDHALFLSVGMQSATRGVVGGLGFLGVDTCGAFTLNGSSWTAVKLGTDLICLGDDAVATSDGTFFIIGAWAQALDFNAYGMQVSTDNGKNFKVIKWGGASMSPEMYPFSGWFQDQTNGWLAGGVDPYSSSNLREMYNLAIRGMPFNISRRLYFDGEKVVHRLITPGGAPEADRYNGLVQKYVNGTFQTVFKTSDEGQTVSQITCTDMNHCWFIAEGVNSTNNEDAAWIYGTSNGGQTWTVVYYAEKVYMNCISALNPTYMWAGGYTVSGHSLTGFFMLSTNGGSTWTTSTTLPDYAPADISIVSTSVAYASAASNYGLSSLLEYSS